MIHLWTEYALNKSNKHFGIKIYYVFSGGVGFTFSLIIIAVDHFRHFCDIKCIVLLNTLL